MNLECTVPTTKLISFAWASFRVPYVTVCFQLLLWQQSYPLTVTSQVSLKVNNLQQLFTAGLSAAVIGMVSRKISIAAVAGNMLLSHKARLRHSGSVTKNKGTSQRYNCRATAVRLNPSKPICLAAFRQY